MSPQGHNVFVRGFNDEEKGRGLFSHMLGKRSLANATTFSSPSPKPRVPAISPEFQHCIGWGRGRAFWKLKGW